MRAGGFVAHLHGRSESPVTAAVDLAYGSPHHKQDERPPLQRIELPLEEQTEEDACGDNLQVAKDLVGGWIHVPAHRTRGRAAVGYAATQP